MGPESSRCSCSRCKGDLARTHENYLRTLREYGADAFPTQIAKWEYEQCEQVFKRVCRAAPIEKEEPLAAWAFNFYLEFLQGDNPCLDYREDVLHKEIKDIGDGVLKQMTAEAFKPKQ